MARFAMSMNYAGAVADSLAGNLYSLTRTLEAMNSPPYFLDLRPSQMEAFTSSIDENKLRVRHFKGGIVGVGSSLPRENLLDELCAAGVDYNTALKYVLNTTMMVLEADPECFVTPIEQLFLAKNNAKKGQRMSVYERKSGLCGVRKSKRWVYEVQARRWAQDNQLYRLTLKAARRINAGDLVTIGISHWNDVMIVRHHVNQDHEENERESRRRARHSNIIF